jgi:hypothetical protein
MKYRSIKDGIGGAVNIARELGEKELNILVKLVEAANNPDMWCNAMRGNGHVKFVL